MSLAGSQKNATVFLVRHISGKSGIAIEFSDIITFCDPSGAWISDLIVKGSLMEATPGNLWATAKACTLYS